LRSRKIPALRSSEVSLKNITHVKGLTPDNPEQLPEVVINAKPFQLTVEMLKKVCPNAPKNVDVFVPYLNDFMPKYGIVSLDSIRAFIANVAVESGEFKYTQEIASGKAYEGRKDLGNIYQGDGVKFKGRALLQTTGRNNYNETGKALGIDLIKHPELLSTPQYAVEASCFYWKSRGLNEVCKEKKIHNWRGKPYTWFDWCCIKVNGGTTHLDRRKQYMEMARMFIK
jgi:putative chitinase